VLVDVTAVVVLETVVATSTEVIDCSLEGVPISAILGFSELLPEELIVTASELVMSEGSSGVISPVLGWADRDEDSPSSGITSLGARGSPVSGAGGGGGSSLSSLFRETSGLDRSVGRPLADGVGADAFPDRGFSMFITGVVVSIGMSMKAPAPR